MKSLSKIFEVLIFSLHNLFRSKWSRWAGNFYIVSQCGYADYGVYLLQYRVNSRTGKRKTRKILIAKVSWLSEAEKIAAQLNHDSKKLIK